jgi:hypothetical protein
MIKLRKHKLAKIGLILYLFTIVNRCSGQDYIRIENIGPNIKYFDILLVSRGRISNVDSMTTTYINLDSSSFARFKSAIIEHLPNRRHVSHPVFGTFEIAIRTSGITRNLYVIGEKKAVAYFRNVVMALNRLNANQNIINRLDTYIKMIGG